MAKVKTLLEIRQTIRNPATRNRILAAAEEDGVKPTVYVRGLINADLKKRDANKNSRPKTISPALLEELRKLFEENK